MRTNATSVCSLKLQVHAAISYLIGVEVLGEQGVERVACVGACSVSMCAFVPVKQVKWVSKEWSVSPVLQRRLQRHYLCCCTSKASKVSTA